jgi:branched-chain amino acid transport system permease protein
MLEQAIGGFVAGGVYAALAVCLVLMYRMLAVLNFAQASIGALGACAALWAYDRQWSVGASVGLGVLAGAALGAVLGLVMVRWFLDASIEVRSAVTIGFFVTADAVGNRILGGSAHTFPDLFGARTLKIADTGVPVGSLVECGGAILVALAIGVFLRRTRTGTLLRALSSRPTTAELLGVRVGILSVGVWTFAAAVSTLAILFVLPTSRDR